MSESIRENLTALNALVPAIYAELRKVAAYHLRRERPNHTLQPTDLVNEVFLVLKKQHSLDLDDRRYVVSLASVMMRRILYNYAKARNRYKRGNGRNIPLDEAQSVTLAGFDHTLIDIIALEAALVELANNDPDQVRIVELHFYGGLTFEETAAVMGISLRTVNRKWKFARAWLYNKLK
ncbi:MAG: sigma-70 family RNA polymerase sigma factor [Acidobacteria bacterium]|nr:sigma-70 family RNA polymerase sigma factor [Acidobacteriota bacterium]